MTPTRQPVHGVLIVDKPRGPSSTQLLGRIKGLYRAHKAGHGGTLDPMASGVLPMLFGDATKFAQEGLDADKGYLATLRLGQDTDSGDAEGQLLRERPVNGLTREDVEGVLIRFLGVQLQVPPMFSALKRDGRPLYELARQGLEVERAPRPITIHSLTLLSFELPILTIQVECSKGTYIRVLAQDIGEALGCGAHLSELRRTRVGSLLATESISLEVLERSDSSERVSFLRPVDFLIQDWVSVRLLEGQEAAFGHGQTIQLSAQQFQETMLSRQCTSMSNDRLRVLGSNERFVGIARLVGSQLRPLRLMSQIGPH
ncbi:MAG: tRNA pseudouridine(55) synthase TruB [Betaproteobacteria bacterium]|nr:tRNA pseudouridine(55) synthase TruB [Betaproteobacteria bacterium]NBY13979.1 tRNA pseudouridine(55) synthase TruB [Betaproteobacteria bacterium]